MTTTPPMFRIELWHSHSTNEWNWRLEFRHTYQNWRVWGLGKATNRTDCYPQIEQAIAGYRESQDDIQQHRNG